MTSWAIDPAYCKSVDELPEPIQAKITGVIPKWITGTLLRNGPGKFEVGETTYRHVYDGLALLQQFVIEDGNVTYFNRFLRSRTYQVNMRAGKIVEGELGTPAAPDPCKNIFARWFSHFFPKEYTDNASVNFCCIKGKIYAITEVPIMSEIDPNNLETLNRVKLADGFKESFKDIFHASSHPQEDKDGNVYNLNVAYTKRNGLAYVITMIPGNTTQGDGASGKPMDGGKIITAIPASRRQAYSHSFGMTEKYFIFIQQPLVVNLWKLVASPFIGCSILETFSWDSSKSTIFHVISRETGEVVSTFSAKPFFFFHVVNAYDMDGDILIDICCYRNSEIFHALYLKEYQTPDESDVEKDHPLTSQLRRYRLPVKNSKGSSHNGQPIIIKSGETEPDFEVLSNSSIDLPRINKKFNRLRYRFVYGCCTSNNTENGLALEKLLKVDVEEKKTTTWSEKGCLASEPVFIAAPDAQEEDDGVILSSVYDKRNDKSFLLVLDGRTFAEIGRAEVPLRFAPTFHGYFV